MAYYAFINEDNVVVEVIGGRDEWETVDGISDWEAYYTTRREGLRAVRTSYNTLAGSHATGGVPFRGNYAGIGFTYDEELDAFIPPRPFDSWILDEETYSWNPPIPYPEEGLEYIWNEEQINWIEYSE
jgi:hypothetical protein